MFQLADRKRNTRIKYPVQCVYLVIREEDTRFKTIPSGAAEGESGSERGHATRCLKSDVEVAKGKEGATEGEKREQD